MFTIILKNKCNAIDIAIHNTASMKNITKSNLVYVIRKSILITAVPAKQYEHDYFLMGKII